MTEHVEESTEECIERHKDDLERTKNAISEYRKFMEISYRDTPVSTVIGHIFNTHEDLYSNNEQNTEELLHMVGCGNTNNYSYPLHFDEMLPYLSKKIMNISVILSPDVFINLHERTHLYNRFLMHLYFCETDIVFVKDSSALKENGTPFIEGGKIYRNDDILDYVIPAIGEARRSLVSDEAVSCGYMRYSKNGFYKDKISGFMYQFIGDYVDEGASDILEFYKEEKKNSKSPLNNVFLEEIYGKKSLKQKTDKIEEFFDIVSRNKKADVMIYSFSNLGGSLVINEFLKEILISGNYLQIIDYDSMLGMNLNLFDIAKMYRTMSDFFNSMENQIEIANREMNKAIEKNGIESVIKQKQNIATRQEIAAEAGVSVSAVDKALKKLREKGFLKK